jgi:hypothetical protein
LNTLHDNLTPRGKQTAPKTGEAVLCATLFILTIVILNKLAPRQSPLPAGRRRRLAGHAGRRAGVWRGHHHLPGGEELLVESIEAENSLFSTATMFIGFVVLLALKMISNPTGD